MTETKLHDTPPCACEPPTARVYVFADILRPGRNRSRRPRRWAWWFGLVILLGAVLVIALG
jgi:hypothetical protein